MAAPVYTGGVSLPSDDSLALDVSDDELLVVDRSGPIWQTLDDLKVLLPSVLRKGTSTLRDAWLLVWGTEALTAQTRFGFVLAAQESPRFAEGLWLDAWGNLLGKPRTLDEIDSDYRARLMIGVDLVSPTAIKTALNALVASYNFAPLIYNEPAVDMAFCGPATTSDDPSEHASKQTIGTLQTWFAFTQPQIPLSGVAGVHQTVFYNKNLRFWANYSGLTGNTKIGAFSAPLGSGFWIIIQAPVEDDALTPHLWPDVYSTGKAQLGVIYGSGLAPSDYMQGITGLTTPSQSVVQGTPSFTTISYGYVPAAYDTLMDKINIEVSRRRAAGVPWVAMVDLPAGNSL